MGDEEPSEENVKLLRETTIADSLERRRHELEAMTDDELEELEENPEWMI